MGKYSEGALTVTALVMIALGFVAGFVVGAVARGSANRVIGWQWDSHGPGLEMVPYNATGETADGIETVRITVWRWDVRYREGNKGEGFLLYDGDTMYHNGDPTKLWFRFVEYHPPEDEDGDPH